MTTQLEFISGPPPAQRHSATSVDAAKEIDQHHDRLRAMVLNYIRSVGYRGATDEELQVVLNMEGNTERPRRRALVTLGLCFDSGKTRPTKSGRKAVVWVSQPF